MFRVLHALRTLSTTMTVSLLATFSAVSLAASGDRVSNAQLSTLISAVQAETDASRQELAVRAIPELLNGAELGDVDSRTLQDLASLLDTSNKEVHRLVAFALSMFEGRASFAVPRLTEILRSAECASLQRPNQADADTATTVRHAIKNISGVNMPPAVCRIKLGEPGGA